MKVYRTIVIGGGVTGLGCAKTLTEHGDDDFLLITKDIGGRVPVSKDGDVNYGAWYVRKNYRHILPFVRKKRRIRLREFTFWRVNGDVTVLNTLKHLPALLRFLVVYKRMQIHYERFKRKSERMSQKKAFESDPFMMRMYETNAAEYCRDHGLEYWSKNYFNYLTRWTSFLNIDDISVAGLAACLAPVAMPTHEFHFEFEKLIADFYDNIEMDEVVTVARTNGHWQVETKNGAHHHAQNLVVAIPTHRARRLIPVHEPVNESITAHMVHVRGTAKPQYSSSNYVVFAERDDIVLMKNENDTYIFYSLSPDYDLSEYFDDHEVIAKKFWNPAFFGGDELIESNRGDNLYLVGAHNIGFMEDCYISGIYAANQILAQQ